MAGVEAPWLAMGSSPERGKRGKEEGNSGGADRGGMGLLGGTMWRGCGATPCSWVLCVWCT
jgi:hypothetical protein